MTVDKLNFSLFVSNSTANIGDTVTCSTTVSNPDTMRSTYRMKYSANGMKFYRAPYTNISAGGTVNASHAFKISSGGTIQICAEPEAVIQPSLSGVQLFPRNNIWYADISTLPVLANSDAMCAAVGGTLKYYFPVPYSVVDETCTWQLLTAANVDSGKVSVSNLGIMYPIPEDPTLHPSDTEYDKTLHIVDREGRFYYELYHYGITPDGIVDATSVRAYDLDSNMIRGADGKLRRSPTFQGTIKYEEIAAGRINHCIMAACNHTNGYTFPAAYAIEHDGGDYPPVGQRFRLKSSFDISGFKSHAKIIAQALKTYGLGVTDQHGEASQFQLDGHPDDRWEYHVGAPLLKDLYTIHSTDFEAVDISSLKVSDNSMEYR